MLLEVCVERVRSMEHAQIRHIHGNGLLAPACTMHLRCDASIYTMCSQHANTNAKHTVATMWFRLHCERLFHNARHHVLVDSNSDTMDEHINDQTSNDVLVQGSCDYLAAAAAAQCPQVIKPTKTIVALCMEFARMRSWDTHNMKRARTSARIKLWAALNPPMKSCDGA